MDKHIGVTFQRIYDALESPARMRDIVDAIPEIAEHHVRMGVWAMVNDRHLELRSDRLFQRREINDGFL